MKKNKKKKLLIKPTIVQFILLPNKNDPFMISEKETLFYKKWIESLIKDDKKSKGNKK